MNQLAFDFTDRPRLRLPDRAPKARNADPATSHAAADESGGIQAAHQRAILAALRDFGPMGKDAIDGHCGMTGVQVCRRLPELVRMGDIEETGRTVRSNAGRAEREWRLYAGLLDA